MHTRSASLAVRVLPAFLLLSGVVACGDDNSSSIVGKGTGRENPEKPDRPDKPADGKKTCENPAMPAPATGSCALRGGGGEATLIRGDIVGVDALYENGHLLIDKAGKIVCAGCDCSQAAGFANARVLQCPGSLVSPGLINAHEHLSYADGAHVPHSDRYDHRHDWRVGKEGHDRLSTPKANAKGAAWAELRHLLGGATSVNGSGGVEGLLRNLDKAGAMQGLGQAAVRYDTFPLGDAKGVTQDSGCAYPKMRKPSTYAASIAYTPHIAEGVNLAAANEFDCLSTGDNDVVSGKTAIIHGVGLTAADYVAMASEGASLIWSPRTNIDLYGYTAPVVLARNVGVQIGLGTDWIASGSFNMMRELRCAYTYSQNNLGGALSARDVLDMATVGAASVLKSEQKIGSLAPGLLADVTIFSGAEHQGYAAAIYGAPKGVALVMRAGSPLYGDAALLEALGAPDSCEALDVCGVDKKVCAVSETGQTLAQLKAALGEGAADIFYCGEPKDEPSCVPFRPEPTGGFTGTPSAGDKDGDGIADASDLCPTVFNAPMPMDGGAQPDADKDGAGDLCDVCPMDANSAACTPPDPSDLDGDKIANVVDNCPSVPNPDQADEDKDGVGDACDACPKVGLPGGYCPASIYAVKKGEAAKGAKVQIKGALVVAVGKSGYFVQTVEGDAGYAGPDFSGVYVYAGKADKPARGDRVDLLAVVGAYWGQLQLGSPQLTVRSSGNPLPAPLLVAPAEIATGGARAKALEGVLVRVESVTVTDATPAPMAGDKAPTYEFEVTGGLRVNDNLYRLTPQPEAGASFAAIQGMLMYSRSSSKLEPRDAADFPAGPVALAGFSLNLAAAQVGATLIGTATLNQATPAPVALTVAVTPASLATAPATVTVPAGAATVDFELTAGAAGSGAVEVSYDGQTQRAPLEVTAAPPPSPIYAVKTGTIAVGTQVTVDEVLVTGVSRYGYVVQVVSGDSGYQGVENSGCFVYTGSSGDKPAVGDRVRVSGAVGDYRGQLRIQDGSFTVASSGNPAPTPADVTAAAAQAPALEGVVVRVQNVTVTAQDAQYNEFEVTDGLRVNDQLYAVPALPAIGTVYTSIQGVMLRSHNQYRLEPRAETDLVVGSLPPVALAGVRLANPAVSVGAAVVATVQLNRADSSDVVVDISLSPAGLATADASVTIPAGSASAELSVTGVAAGAVTVTATWGGSSQTAALTVAAAPSGVQPWINELHYDNAGGDTDEGVEIAGLAGTDLSGWTVEAYRGNGSVYRTINLSGTLSDQTRGYGFAHQALPANGLQNGRTGLALVSPTGTVVEFICIEGAVTATAGAANGQTCVDIGVSEPGSTPVGTSLQRAGTGTQASDFSWRTSQAATWGAVNPGQSFN